MTPAADPSTQDHMIGKDGFRATYYEMVGQYGTHVDPPAHFAENGATMDQIPLKQMILPLIVFDATPLLTTDPNHAFSLDDITQGTQDIDAFQKAHSLRYAPICPRISSTNSERFKRHTFPAWSLEAIKFLYEQRGVTATGHKSLDTDATDKMEAETYLLQHGHYQIEVMANLDQVPARGALIVVTWPKVRNGLGFPARAFAILP